MKNTYKHNVTVYNPVDVEFWKELLNADEKVTKFERINESGNGGCCVEFVWSEIDD